MVATDIMHRSQGCSADAGQTCSRGWAVASAAFFCIASACIIGTGRFDNSAFIKMGLPVDNVLTPMSILGYSYLDGSRPIHKENVSFLSQILLNNGYADGIFDVYFVRPLYAFVCGIILPLVGIYPSFILVNLLAWGFAAWVAWKLARNGGGLAGFLAVALVAGGMGFVSHCGDYSAHLFSFAWYYASVWVVIRSGVLERQLTLRQHAALGAFLALGCLVYSTGTYAVIGYAIASWKYNRKVHIAAASAMALSVNKLWILLLCCAVSVTQSVSFHRIYAAFGLEGVYLKDSMGLWVQQLGNPAAFAGMLAKRIAEFLSFDSPLVVGCGIVALIAAVKDRVLPRSLLSFLLLPFVGGLAFSMSAGARGYIVYGASVLLYVPLSLYSTRLVTSRATPGGRAVVVAGLLVLLASHFCWSLAYHAGTLAPLKAYFLGMPDNIRLFTRTPRIMSITSGLVTPRIAGGKAVIPRPAVEGATFTARRGHVDVDLNRAPALKFRVAAAAAYRGLFYLYISVLLVCWWHTKGAWFGGGFILLSLLPLFLSPMQGRAPWRTDIINIDRALSVPDSTAELQYSMEVSPAFAREYARCIGSAARVQFLFLGARNGQRVRIQFGRDSLFGVIDRGTITSGAADLRRSFESNRQLTVAYAGVVGGRLGGWQNNGLDGRRLSVNGSEVLGGVLPATEVRLRDDKGTALLIGF